MRLYKFILPFLFCLSSSISAQTVRNDEFGNIANLAEAKFVRAVEEVKIDGVENENKISYDRIKGSRFWKDEWLPALLYSNTGYVGTLPVRINLASGELHFLKNSEELILTDNFIAKIIFPTLTDSAVFISQVPNLLLNKKQVDDFVQVLNSGKYQLLKYTKRNVSSADSMFHTLKRYFFSDLIYYFIKSNEKVERIKKFNKEGVLFYLPSSSAYDAWIKENNIDFKKEKDVVLFLNYYNAHSPTL
jgi:hypothetical protein